MLIKTRGIVFRTVNYSETSLIVDIYTEDRGLQKYIVNGVRSPKARVKASLFQVMSLLNLVVYYREHRDLHRIRELQPAYVFRSIPFQVRRGAIGLFMAEIARKTLRESEEHRDLFDFLYQTFLYLDQTEHPVANLHLHFMTHLTAYLGFIPGGDYQAATPYFDLREGLFVPNPPSHGYSLDEASSRLLYQFLQAEREQCHLIGQTAGQRRALLQHLLDFYRLHIENFPQINSHEILQDVLE